MNPDYFETHSACGRFNKCNNGQGCDSCEFGQDLV